MPKEQKSKLNLGKTNMWLLVIAAVLLIIGYVIMSFNEITISVIILIFAYAFLIPFALLYHPKKKEDDTSK